MPAMNENCIVMHTHCGRCLESVPDGVSPQEWRMVEVGFTEKGLQVWCLRHDCNIMHVDFQGARHPADTTRKKSDARRPQAGAGTAGGFPADRLRN